MFKHIGKMFEYITNRYRALVLALLPLLLFLIPWVRETTANHWVLNSAFGLLYLWRVWATVKEENNWRFRNLPFRGVFPLLWPMMALLPWKTHDMAKSPKWVTYILILWVPVVWFIVTICLYSWDNYVPEPGPFLTDESWIVIGWNWFGGFYLSHREGIWVGLVGLAVLFVQTCRHGSKLESLRKHLNSVAISWKSQAEQVENDIKTWKAWRQDLEVKHGPTLAEAIVAIKASKKLAKDPRMAKAKESLKALLLAVTGGNGNRAEALLWQAQVAMEEAAEATATATPPATSPEAAETTADTPATGA